MKVNTLRPVESAEPGTGMDTLAAQDPIAKAISDANISERITAPFGMF